MFRTILLAYDGSPASAHALQCAGDLAHRYGAELHLLGIVNSSETISIAEGPVKDLWGMEKDHLEQAMNVAAVGLEKLGVKAVLEIRVGVPAREILAYAQSIEADLAVLGHAEKGVFARWFEGSVSADILSHLPCHLLVTTANGPNPEHLPQ